MPLLQVVVLVTEDLKVICLNHNLQKEWEEDLAVRPQGACLVVVCCSAAWPVMNCRGSGGRTWR